jgi:pentatricopeptide repeat protein
MLWHSAVVSEEIRNYEQAVIDCTDLMRLQNDKHSYSYLNALAFRARMHTLSLQWDKAIKDWTDLTKLQPEENYNYRMLANCYFSQGKYELAMQCYDESLKLRIADSQTYYKKANMQIVLRDYEGALRTLEQRSKLSDGLRPNVYLTRGYIRSLQGLDADASTEYQLAINSMKKDSTCWDEIARATAYLQIGNESGALECLNKAKRLGFTAHSFFTDETSQPDELRKKLMRFVLQRKVFPADQLGRTPI